MEKQYRLKEEVKKYFNYKFDKDLQGDLEFWDKCNHIDIEALEEVKPKRVEVVSMCFNNNKVGNTKDIYNACEFMLNDLLPYGVTDKESHNSESAEWEVYAYGQRARGEMITGFTDWLKQSKQQ